MIIINAEELKQYVEALLNKAEEAYLMSMEIINKPTINYRTEGFCFFICNAWELLLKAFLINKTQDINIINYKNDSNRTISLDDCVEKVFTSTTDKTKNNITFIRNIRNKATHLILPEFDFILSPVFQRCLTNFNKFFKKHFPNYKLNEKVTPFIALVNPGNDENVSSLILNPANLLLLEKVKKELDNDDSLSQTLRLISTNKETEADIKFALTKDSEEKARLINVPKNIEKTHPYTTNEVIKRIKETLEMSLGPNHGFTSNKFQDICKRKGIKNNQDYCYQFEYSKNKIYKYSGITIEYVSRIYLEEIKK